jgi:hypothetical protein
MSGKNLPGFWLLVDNKNRQMEAGGGGLEKNLKVGISNAIAKKGEPGIGSPSQAGC